MLTDLPIFKMNGVELFIPLTQGYVAVVDVEDWGKVRPYKWCALLRDGIPYAVILRKRKTVYLHQVIAGKKNSYEIDHRDRNTLNNKRENLRFATKSQNQANQKIRSDNTSGFKGVNWRKDIAAWAARVSVMNKRIHLGHFPTAEAAARAYDTAAQKHFGEFARLNFPAGV